ncbi:hypothetical protein CC99x_008815 [Candidatus Berkiella cookevillensis]|uniref:Uncharacterized protein n=1 Tax=Candidatus Berkiella cookevillensis TaxID=437022 RepID=A0AAE3HR52_9GAMM|nr:hypothetical protein [Candidatus Berkiella cookevillensis]MCS5709002.1 hypothetical protein [Candidatus Berkiella cookevillensis]
MNIAYLFSNGLELTVCFLSTFNKIKVFELNVLGYLSYEATNDLLG